MKKGSFNIHPFMRIVMLAVLAFMACPCPAQTKGYLVRGIVRDSITNEPLQYASVTLSGKHKGTLTDMKGIFDLTVEDNTDTITVIIQGYARKKLPIRKNRVNLYEIRLTPEAQDLKEVVITKRKYSKKNNPAVDLMQRIRKTQDVNDPLRNPYFNYDKYERMTLALNNFTEKTASNALFRKFPFLWEHVDTSEVSGKPILNIMVKETSSQVHDRRSPKAHREVITGLKSSGIDQITDQESMRIFMEDVLREIDLYDKDINLLQNRFVSPLSPLAADFYKFYITDSVQIDGKKALVLSFYPHNKAAFGFVGNMYVEPSDTAMFIRRVTMRVPAEINLNFVENMYVNQEFEQAPDGSRLKTHDDLILEISILPGAQGLYVRRNVAYANHNFDRPEDENTIFKALATKTVEKEAENRDAVFWDGVRLIELPKSESSVDALMTRLRKVPLYYWSEKIIKYLFSGYIATSKTKSYFDVGPLNTFISGNKLEGVRLRLGGMTTANLSKHWFTRFYGAWGTRDHRWKYGVNLEYSFNEKKYHSNEFPIHSLKLSSSYDVDRLGEHYLFTNADNFVLSLKRMDEKYLSYRLSNGLTYHLELENNFSVKAEVCAERQWGSRLMGFSVTGPESGSLPLWRFDENWGEITLRYALGEKFYQTRSHRLPINMDAPVLTLIHRYAAKGLGSRWTANRTEASIAKRFWFSAWGYLDVLAKGGHVWSRRTPFTQMFIPNVNLSYTVQPESFTLMNPLEFITDSYAQLDLTYWANGAILNYIPFIKKAKLREVFSARTYWGRLSRRNNPAYNSNMLDFPAGDDVAKISVAHTPYVEVGVGIDNIFKCLRLDYVWRITHRDVPYTIDKSGLRVAFHITF